MRYKTKAEWAEAKARELRTKARLLPLVPSADWRNVRRRVVAIRTINADAHRFERLAARYRAEGR